MALYINPWNNPIDPHDSLADEVEEFLAECDFETYVAYGLLYISEKIEKVLKMKCNPDTNAIEDNIGIQEQLMEAFSVAILEIRTTTELQQRLLKGIVTDENDKIFRQSGIDFKNSVLKARNAWDEIADTIIEDSKKLLFIPNT